MKSLFTYLKTLLIITLIIIVIYVFATDATQTLPKNAEVMVDDSLRIYYSPQYFYDYKANGWEKLRLTTYNEVKEYNPDPKCCKLGYFTDELGSPFWGWVESMGWMEKKRRWNKDGSWNW